MPKVAVNGVSLHYLHYPAEHAASVDSPPVLLLAGMASDSASWQPAVEPLRQQFALLIPDNRCTGRTTPSAIASSRESMVTDILCLLDELHIERVSIVGHSMGAMLGWALACTAPEKVATGTAELPRHTDDRQPLSADDACGVADLFMPTRLDKHANLEAHSKEHEQDKPRDADRMDSAIQKTTQA